MTVEVEISFTVEVEEDEYEIDTDVGEEVDEEAIADEVKEAFIRMPEEFLRKYRPSQGSVRAEVV